MTSARGHRAIVYCLNSSKSTDTQTGRHNGYEREKKPCPGSRELERRALVGTDWRRALDGENLRRAIKKGTWSEIGVKRRKDDERPGGVENRR
ncbi:hypothetical protein TNCV_4709961 [Trichonephila clavipes]|nr:hypothetical protein TNCV_4709961 [Trichonephila clavipes]